MPSGLLRENSNESFGGGGVYHRANGADVADVPIRLSLPMEGRVASGRCADGAPYTSVTYGPLLFALRIQLLNTTLMLPIRPSAPISPCPKRLSLPQTNLALRPLGATAFRISMFAVEDLE